MDGQGKIPLEWMTGGSPMLGKPPSLFGDEGIYSGDLGTLGYEKGVLLCAVLSPSLEAIWFRVEPRIQIIEEISNHQ